MTKAKTGQLKMADGQKLFYRSWPGRPDKPVLLFVHGLGEHSGRYGNPVQYFSRLGYTIYAYDHRGHGRSEGRRAFVRGFSELLGDLDHVLGFIRSKEGKKKIFIVAHSFGGQVALTYAARHGNGIAGLVVSSANIRLKMPVPTLKRVGGEIMSRIIPSLNVESGIDPAGISHDPKEVEAYEKDPLINHRLTVRLATEMFNNQDKLLKIARDLKVACFFMHGTEDPISDPKGSEDFYNACASTDKELKLYPGLYHELFNELERQTVFQDVDEWLKARA